MGLSTTSKANQAYGPGVFISEATIIDAQNHSGTAPSFLQNIPDVYLVVTLDIGKDWTPEMSFFGDFKRDRQDPTAIVGWGSAFKIRNLFTACGIQREINDDGTIPEDMVNDLIGKKILRLQYVSGARENGRLKYSDWTEQVLAAGEDPKKLADLFFKSVQRGFPRNYFPDVLNENDSFNTRESESGVAIPSADRDF
jgi:hypothetical protein